MIAIFEQSNSEEVALSCEQVVTIKPAWEGVSRITMTDGTAYHVNGCIQEVVSKFQGAA